MSTVSREEYLKKYMDVSSTATDKKKKKKKQKDDRKNLRIYEDDAFAVVLPGSGKKEKESDDEVEIETIQAAIKEKVKEVEIKSKFKNAFTSDGDIDNSTPRDNGNADFLEQTSRKQVVSSPKRRRRHDSDESPPRSSRQVTRSADNFVNSFNQKIQQMDSSPKRRRRHDSDESPPRNSRNVDPSPKRRRRHDSDESPPRNSRNDDFHKRKRRDLDLSPPRSAQTDLSPPRKSVKREVDSDEEPERRRPAQSDSRGRRVTSPEITTDNSRKTLDGKTAGLQTASSLKEESEKLREREDKLFSELDASTSGRGAATVIRDKQIQKGRRGKDDAEAQAKKEREAKKTEELKEKFKDWNKGVKQLRDREEILQEAARVAAEPLARSRDDEAMNQHLKSILHESDPMADILKKKNIDDAIDRGEVVYPTYKGACMPNRYGIRPGYRWDGVDRSNGFESKMQVAGNKKKAQDEQYYQYSNIMD